MALKITLVALVALIGMVIWKESDPYPTIAFICGMALLGSFVLGAANRNV